MTHNAARSFDPPISERPTLIPRRPHSFVTQDTSAVDAAWPVDAPRHSLIARRGKYSSSPDESGTFLVESSRTPRLPPPLEYDLFEDDRAFLVLIDMPGVLPETLKVDLSLGALHVKATVPRDPRRLSPLLEGDHEVVIDVPKEVEADSIDALLRNGVLRVRIVKPGPAARHVDILP